MIAEVHGGEQYALSGFEAGDIFPDLDDFTSDVAARDVRKLYAGESFANPKVEMVHGARFDPDENLILAWLGVGDVFIAEDFGASEFVNDSSFHAGLPSLRP
jgi:hypothetical protein